jgi:hypothetical protein
MAGADVHVFARIKTANAPLPTVCMGSWEFHFMRWARRLSGRFEELESITRAGGDVLTRQQPLGVIGATGRAIDPLKFLHAAEVR